VLLGSEGELHIAGGGVLQSEIGCGKQQRMFAAAGLWVLGTAAFVCCCWVGAEPVLIIDSRWAGEM
jgi:hypothetical protein